MLLALVLNETPADRLRNIAHCLHVCLFQAAYPNTSALFAVRKN
jgi:hypothetical protein